MGSLSLAAPRKPHRYIYTYTQWKIIQQIKKEILLFVTTWMNLEDMLLSEINRECKYCMVSLRCGIWGERGKLIETEKKDGWHGLAGGE